MALIHRRLEAGADIPPLKVADLDAARVYCRNQVDVRLKAQPTLDDQGLKEAILNDADCPDLIKRLSLDRPSVFDLLCSKSRFRPDLFDLQRKLLLQLENKDVAESDAFNELFRSLIPNSSTIIKDLQKAAAAHQARANIQ
jgi:hypothetical protein